VRRRHPRALEEEEAGLLQLKVSSTSPYAFDFEGLVFTPLLFVWRVTPIVPALTPAKALRSGAPTTTRRRSARVSWTAMGAVAAGGPSRNAAVATGLQQEEAAAATSQVLAPRAPSQGHGRARPEGRPAGDQEAVAEAVDEDTPPGWGQSRGQPASGPERMLGCW
jgi:hypothetical protein